MPSLLWIDSRAGLSAGAFALLAAPWLSDLYALPLSLLVGMGIANVAYGSYSFTLERRLHRPRGMVIALVVANAAWGMLCLLTAAAVAGSASPFGMAHLIFEGLFVGGLAVLEWRARDTMATAG